MRKILLAGAAGLCVGVAMLALGLAAGSSGTPSPGANPAPVAETIDRPAVETIVRDYLVANPEVLLDVQAALENKHREQQRQVQSAAISGYADSLFLADSDGVLGNPEGSVTIVEFFDYNCGYCKRALSDMEAMLAADPDLRFVLKEFPILGPDSQKAHVASMAFRSLHPELYPDFHRRLLGSDGRADEAAAVALALELGADEGSLRAAMANPEINQALALNYEIANVLSITGTPSYVIGDEVVYGALGHETLTTKVANFRECQSTSC